MEMRIGQAPGDTRVMMEGISKAFGPVQALNDVKLALYPGEIHTLAGENGSGKSTLLRILGGVIRSDTGRVIVEGVEHDFPNVRAAMREGVTVVSQELSLVPALSVAENVFLGHQQVREARGINWKKTQAACSVILNRLNLDIDTSVPVGTLPQDQQQLIEIARALAFESRVILLDEPTSSLEPNEVESLFQVMRQLRDEGVAIVFISHRMREMLEISDRYTVLRDGRFIDTAPAEGVDSSWLIERMVLKRRATIGQASVTTGAAAPGRVQLVEVDKLRDRSGRVDGVSLTLFSGEIAGLAGLAGAGRTEFVETLVGYRHRESGSVRVLDKEVGGTTRDAVKAGLSLVPDDRRYKSAVLDMSVRDNLLLSSRGAPWVPRSKSQEGAIVRGWVDKLRIKTSDIDAPLKTLSGGNQQKVIIARCLQVSPKLLILDEPTRGIDLGARAEIYEILRSLAAEGLSILTVSSELEEIFQISDRVLVMHAGQLSADIPRAEATEQLVIAAATGHLQ
jgi:rhamnose transport system ATP-binding protein